MKATETGAGAECEATGREGRLRIEFNPTFASYLHRKDNPRWTLSTQRRPDIVVSWLPNEGEGTWLPATTGHTPGNESNFMRKYLAGEVTRVYDHHTDF